jgi:hypothetical protein
MVDETRIELVQPQFQCGTLPTELFIHLLSCVEESNFYNFFAEQYITNLTTQLLGLALGLEPYSPHSQCGTLPVKLKPTFVIEFGLAPISSNSKFDMLTIAQLNIF